ncbi:uncharacterized protein LOC125870147 [Solanum stenotomum]|uniref:uncharacterized protein LOC125870147 n=1 Tax=Solanum stenotomum TaxID=172797 RepID=UPI0020D10FBF|nr:uncharacterized protein LOC125870147 [Solanum stenotomum]
MKAAIFKQKTQLQWFREGDANTKYFHSLMRGRRRKLFIHQISNESGEWIQGDVNIARATCAHFQNIFTGHQDNINEEILQCIPRLITDEQNKALKANPAIEQVKQVVFPLNPNSAAGPDGMNGNFFQVCWDIIKEDLYRAVLAFFCGHNMPKYMTHACLVLLPKVDHPNKLSEFRPISLSNFSNKIISKLLSIRISPILSNLFLENQSGFVRGRSISENIMLAQEIIQGIKKPKEGDNVVIKQDMAKAYDRVSWAYTCLVMRKMGLVSDQLINRDKSHFMLHVDSPQGIAEMIKEEAGFTQKDNPINYLGCPLLTLVKHVLHSIPFHTMAAISPPKTTFHYIKRLTADFFRGREKDKKKYHWASWENITFPYDEGGLGRANPVAKKWDTGQSLVWKYISNNKSQVEEHIICKIISVPKGVADQPIWKLTDNGKFTCASAWENIITKRPKNKLYSYIWNRHIPFKVSFLLWRALRRKLPTNDKTTTFGVPPVKCSCCIKAGWDTIDHIFVTGHFAIHIWQYHSAILGVRHDKIPLNNLVTRWWTMEHTNEVQKLLYHTMPIIISWNLWKNSCSAKYVGKQSSSARTKFMIIKDTSLLLNTVFPYLQ